jgi:hypothetical protein
MIFLTCDRRKALMTCGLQVAKVLRSTQIASALQCNKLSEQKANLLRQIDLHPWLFPVDTV